MRWLWGNSTPPSCSRTISVSSWSARRSTMGTDRVRRAPQVRRSRWAVKITSYTILLKMSDRKLLHNNWKSATNELSLPLAFLTPVLNFIFPFLPLLVNTLPCAFCSAFFYIFHVFLGGPEEYRGGGGSGDAQGHFRRPAEWGRDGQSYGGGWRGSHLPCEKHCLQLGRTDIQAK